MTDAAQIEVTQGDRIAAWPFAPLCYRLDQTAGVKERWLSGTYDSCMVMQAFARHRTAAEAQAREEGRQDALHEAAANEPVVVIGKDWSLLWASQDTLKAIVDRTGIKIGTRLYALATKATPDAG